MISAHIIVEVVSTVMSMICIPINGLFVYLIYKERHRQPYGSPFFRLCIHLSVADILMAIFSTIFFKFPIFGFFPESFYRENWSIIPIAGVNYFTHAQAIGIIFIAVNRFTAVFYPIKHKNTWWRPNVTTFLLCLQWTLPILSVFPLLFSEFTFITEPDTGSVIFTSKDQHFHKVYFLGLAVLDGVVINLVVSLLYLAIFIRVQTHVVVRRPGELVMRLALSAFIIFVSYLALGILSFLSALTPPKDAWMYHTLWFVVNDVLCASNAPVLLALNKPIRQLFMRRLGVQPDKQATLLSHHAV